ncbi:hypothetical protein [uncultured Microbacterium sp.]|uniref:hypothetical protein n=1 Tax=uncultured Microbacterium sp. TaxID=191216 RepID=UPI0025F66BA0|nr:hypothetical protein [uncultured Microbacterium sp.]
MTQTPPLTAVEPPASLIRADHAASAGSYPAVDRALLRIRPAVYTVREEWEALPQWDRYLLRVHAYATVRGGAMFSHESAAALLGLPLFGHPRDIHVFDCRRTRSLRFGDVAVHTSADPRSALHLGELRTTTVLDTVLDLVRCLPPAFGLAVADDATRRMGITREGLLARASQQRTNRGRRRVEWIGEHMDARAESVAESISRAVAQWCGFPRPALQREHRADGRTYRSDLSWPEHRVIGECDGWQKYGTGDDATRAFREEKRREDALRRAGWKVARWDYAGALRVDGMRDALLSAGLPLIHPADTARLTTLRQRRPSFEKRGGE